MKAAQEVEFNLPNEAYMASYWGTYNKADSMNSATNLTEVGI